MFYSIQGLRAVAAILVVVHHYNEVLLTLAKHGLGEAPALMTLGHMKIFGAVGVPVFFVISGFVMGLQRFEQGREGTWQFTAKRIARVAPIYWAVTLVFAFLHPVYTTDHVVRSLLFLAGKPVVGPGWTLEYEMFFYLAFAGVVVTGLFGGRVLATCALIGGFIILATIGAASPIILEFCAGLVAAYTYKHIGRFGPLVAVVGVVVFAASTVSFTHSWPVIRTMWSAGSFLVVLGLAASEYRGFAIMKSGLFQVLGAASYSIYLVHMPLVLAGNKYPLWIWHWHLYADPHIALFVMVAVAAAAGVLVHYAVEKRLTRWTLTLLLPPKARPVPI